MAKQRIDAIIIQKIATETEWNNIGRVPEKGEFMLIQNSVSQPVNLKIGDGNRAFSALPNFIQYDQAAYVAPSGNTLPVPQNGVGYSLLTEGNYNGGALVVPTGNLGKAEYIGNAWVVTNMALPSPDISGLATKTDIEQKADLVTGKNKFNKDATHVNGSFINQAGNISTSSTFFISEYIPVQPTTVYSYFGWNIGGAYNAWYDGNNNLISTFNTSPSTSPANARYVRISGIMANKAAIQFQISDGTAVYEPFSEFVKPDQIKLDLAQTVVATDVQKAPSGSAVSLALSSKLNVSLGKNLFNKNSNEIKDGQFINSSGNIATSSSYFTSGLIEIPLVPQLTFFGTNLGGARNAWYDANKSLISVFNTSTTNRPDNARYVRISGLIADKNNIQLQVTDGTQVYEPYTDVAFLEELKKSVYDQPIKLVMPSKLFFVTGIQSAIYHENILMKNTRDAASVISTLGLSYKELIMLNFTSAIANGTSTFTPIYALKRLASKTVNHIVNLPTRNSGKTMNLLFIGDSFTDLLTYVQKCRQLLQDAGATINLIGTRGNSSTKAEGFSGGTLANTFLNTSAGVSRTVDVTGVSQIPQTSFPGTVYLDSTGKEWAVRGGKIDQNGVGKVLVNNFGATNADFANFPVSGVLTKKSGQTNREGDNVINYTNATAGYVNQFINPTTGQLDITNYITRWGFNAPDLVFLQFTYNDMPAWPTDTQINNFFNNIKTSVDHIHGAYPSCKVIFSIEPFGSMSVNNTAGRSNGSTTTQDVNGRKYGVLKLADMMFSYYENNADYNTFFHIMPAYAVVDLVNGYSTVTVTPLARYPEITERSGGDGIHPDTNGME